MPDLSAWQINVGAYNPTRNRGIVEYAARTTSAVRFTNPVSACNKPRAPYQDALAFV